MREHRPATRCGAGANLGGRVCGGTRGYSGRRATTGTAAEDTTP